ncbi:LOW QUALITY PROTEIN: hypothetical protein Cgig2_013909 [Carnegiea gigantea]|uniref:Uncharacterized protein n=1 Tax=Carnegiea gigantea TaxID=171969 RepID=A0A9Q1Q8M5_9CARY|nr:LOW QUALITY PROTEIN: hypothetical protein Cgig2_013909 [Carnegiea gigantea]
MSGLLFPCTTGGVVWELIGMTEDVEGMGKYNWPTTIWSFLVEAIEEMKCGSMSIQICMLMQMRNACHRLQVNLYVGRNYDGTMLISLVKDNQVNYIVSLFVVTDVLCLVRVVVFDCADGPLAGSSGYGERRADRHPKLGRVAATGKGGTAPEERGLCCHEEEAGVHDDITYGYRGEAAEVEKGLLLSPTWEGSRDGPTQVAHQMSVVTRVTLDALRGRVL